MVKKIRAILLFLTLSILLTLFLGCRQDQRLATVGRIEIRASEVDSIVNRLKAEHPGFFEQKDFEREVRKKVLKGLITGALIENNLEFLGLEVKKEEIDAEAEKYKRFYGRKFTKVLEDFGFTEKSFRYAIFRSILFRKALKMVEKEVKPVTEEEMKEYYQKHRQDFEIKPLYRAFLAEIGSGKEAQRIGKKVKKKMDAYQIALEFNLQPFEGFSEFDTGFKTESDFPLPIARRLARLKPGQTAMPFRVNNKWCLVKLISKKEKGVKSFSEVKNYINNLLYQRHKEQAWVRLIKRLEKRTPVQIYQKI